MRRSSITVLPLILAGMTLAGCNESSPSESTVEKQIANQYSNCLPMSVRDFQKINGFPQKDGSYIVSVKYTLLLKPTEKAANYADEYKVKDKEVDDSLNGLNARAEQIKNTIQNDLSPNVLPKMKILFDDRDQKCGSLNGVNKTGNPECEASKEAIKNYDVESHWSKTIKERDDIDRQIQLITDDKRSLRNKYYELASGEFEKRCGRGVMEMLYHSVNMDDYKKYLSVTINRDFHFINSDNG